MHWLSRCSVFYFREPTFPTKSLMEPIHRLIPALNIECPCPRTLNALGATDPRQRHCRLGPRQTKAMRSVPHIPAKRTPDRSVPSPSLFDVLSDTLGHDGPEAQSHSASPREADSMSQRAQSPAAQSPAAQWLNAPSKAHPGSCRPCWFTAKGKGCHRNGCLFCHKPHDTADVKHLRHPGGRIRQRVAMRKGRDDSCVQSEPVKSQRPESQPQPDAEPEPQEPKSSSTHSVAVAKVGPVYFATASSTRATFIWHDQSHSLVSPETIAALESMAGSR